MNNMPVNYKYYLNQDRPVSFERVAEPMKSKCKCKDDSRRLKWLILTGCLPTKFELLTEDSTQYAIREAVKNGRKTANEDDILNGFKQMIDDAIIEEEKT